MAKPVIMPRQGQSVESCILSEWHKKVGDKVKVGDKLFTYETDKATFEEEAKDEGEMLAIFFEEGEDVECLVNVCVIGEPGEDISEYEPEASAGEPEGEKPESEAKASEKEDKQESSMDAETKKSDDQDIPPESKTDTDVSRISPRAKNLAEKKGADLRFADPTGPKGRIIERDIQKLVEEGKLATKAAGTSYETKTAGSGIGGRVRVADTERDAVGEPESYEEKHSNIRKVIAKTMQKSLTEAAQLTLDASFDATDILRLRKKLKNAAQSGLDMEIVNNIPTINDIILFAVSRVLKSHRLCNAHYYPEKMVFFNTVNLGIAVDTPRGLMVPTVFNADKMNIIEISQSVKTLAADCQQGTISPDNLTGGTFTVTNLGTLGVESFTPVLNPPQTCILGVNTLKAAVKEVDGKPEIYQSMGLSLTFDHRALDGAPAARFLKDLKENLENVSFLLMA